MGADNTKTSQSSSAAQRACRGAKGHLQLLVALSLLLVVILVALAWILRPSEEPWYSDVPAYIALALALLNMYLTQWCGPKVRAIEPPSVVLENPRRVGDGTETECSSRLFIHVPLTFVNEGARPGIVSDLDLRLTMRPTLDSEEGLPWHTDWPGPNHPVEHPEFEPVPIRVPPKGSEGKVVRFYVKDECSTTPAEGIREGQLTLSLSFCVNGDSQPAGWSWMGKVSCEDAKRLRREGEQPPIYRRITRDGTTK